MAAQEEFVMEISILVMGIPYSHIVMEKLQNYEIDEEENTKRNFG